MRKIVLGLSLLCVPVALTAVTMRPRAHAAPAAPRVADFALVGADGKPFTLYSLAGKKAAVLFFAGADCPVAKLYLPRLKELAARYGKLGVAFVVIDSNAHETPAQMRNAAKAAGVTSPVLMDPNQAVADQLKVTRTCEALLLDGQATLRYRGAIDDQYGFTSRRPAPQSRFLADALDATLAGKPVGKASAPAVGCLLDRLPESENPDAPPADAPEAALPGVGKVTWAREVAPILQAKCESCHRPGQVGPFPLQTYDHARRWAAMIGETVEKKRMPPWHADPRHGDFANDRSLSPLQRATVLAWVKQGAPQGDPKKAPAPRSFLGGWNIGKPDAIFTMEKPYTIKPTGTLPYQWFRIPTDFAEDRWVQAAEVKPGERTAIHHVLVFLDEGAEGGRRGQGGNGLDGFIAEYVPGESPTIFPEGVAKRLPKGATLRLQVHYTPTGAEKTDRTSVGFIFAKEPPKAVADTVGIFQPRLQIPPGAESHRVERQFTLPVDATVYSYSPHMHLRGKAFRMSAKFPDGTSETLLSVPHYDFNWQTRYMLKQPRKLPKGATLIVEAWYDNSAKNPHNPDPTKTVTWGEQTFDEMMIGYVDYVAEGNNTRLVRMQNLLGSFRGK